MATKRIAAMDEFPFQYSVASRVTEAGLPVSPAKGVRYLVTDGTYIDQIAYCSNATGPVWTRVPATNGWLIWVDDESKYYKMSGGVWSEYLGQAGPTGETGPQGIQGVTGETGPQGIQGVTGATGADGSLNAVARAGDTMTGPLVMADGATIQVSDIADPSRVYISSDSVSVGNTGNTVHATLGSSLTEGLIYATGVSGAVYLNTELNSYINNAGNLGIGTTGPLHKLDVAGDINTSGAFMIDGVTFSGGADRVLKAGDTMTGPLDMGANKITSSYVPLDPADLVNKTALDNAISGLSWRHPVEAFNLIGNADAAYIAGVIGTSDIGDNYLLTEEYVFTGFTGATGDIVECQGATADWVLLVANSGGAPAAGVRVIIAGAGGTAIAPYVGEEDKIFQFAGATLTATATAETVDAASILVHDIGASGSVGFYDNASFVYEGTVPTGEWIQFNGANQIVAGTGLDKLGNTIFIEPGVMTNIAEGASAYGWGDHALAGYVTEGQTAAWNAKVDRAGDTMTGTLNISAVGSPASFLLHCDGATYTFVDSSTNVHTMTASGTISQTYAQSKFGGKSIYCDGSASTVNSEVTPDVDFGTGDFTIDLWMKSGQTAADYSGMIANNLPGINGHWRITNRFGADTVAFHLCANSTYIGIQGPAVNDDSWHHVALTRASGVFRLFVDGTIGGTLSGYESTPMGTTGTKLLIGENLADGAFYEGYLDEIRVAKGTAVWTDTFVPPSAPYSIIGPAVNTTGDIIGGSFVGDGSQLTNVPSDAVYVPEYKALEVNY